MKRNILLSDLETFNGELLDISPGRLCVATINAHSYNLAQQDMQFATALLRSDILLPDGIGIILGKRLLTGEKIRKIAGEDFFYYEMARLQQIGGVSFFLGSSPTVLQKIKEVTSKRFPGITVFTYSPPFKESFNEKETEQMLAAINQIKPDVLFVGMTAPKQEKWVYENYHKLMATHVVSIGAVFDFYAGTVSRAPKLFRISGMEWLYRLIKEPRRMWRRYLIGNSIYIISMIYEYFHRKNNS